MGFVSLPGLWFLRDGSARGRAARGTVWTTAGFGAQQALRLLSSLVLTRLLTPEAFGLMALVQLLTNGLRMFSEIGVLPAMKRDERGDDPAFVATAWTLEACRGPVLWLAAVGLAWPFSRLYDEPLLLLLIPVSALGLFFKGMSSPGVLLAERHMRLGRLNILGVVAQLLALVLMVVWAWIDATVWALAAGWVAAGLFYMALSYVVFRGGVPRPRIERDAFRRIARLGKWIFAGTAVLFFSQQLDRFLMGKLVDLGTLGVYAMALGLAEIPVVIHQRLTRQVLGPLLGQKYRSDPGGMAAAYDRGRRGLDAIGMPITGVLAGLGPLVVIVLYDDRYVAAGWMLSLLSVRGAMRVLLEPCSECLTALGHTRHGLVQNAVRLVWLSVSLPLGYAIGGVPGLVIAAGLSELPVFAVMWSEMVRHGLLSWRRELFGVLLFVASAAGAGVLLLLVVRGLDLRLVA